MLSYICIGFFGERSIKYDYFDPTGEETTHFYKRTKIIGVLRKSIGQRYILFRDKETIEMYGE